MIKNVLIFRCLIYLLKQICFRSPPHLKQLLHKNSRPPIPKLFLVLFLKTISLEPKHLLQVLTSRIRTCLPLTNNSPTISYIRATLHRQKTIIIPQPLKFWMFLKKPEKVALQNVLPNSPQPRRLKLRKEDQARKTNQMQPITVLPPIAAPQKT